MTAPTAHGLHHITAISGDARRTVDFYATTLGLRLVKRTVNFEDPGSWHLYFGDETGSPGSLLTFFPWVGAPRGRAGNGQAVVISFAVPPESFGAWIHRFLRLGVKHESPTKRRDESVLEFRDPDGMQLELVSTPDIAGRRPWTGAALDADIAIRGLHTVTIWVEHERETRMLLVDTLGFRHVASDGSHHRFESGQGGSGTFVDVRAVGGFVRGVEGVGTVHHVAWRVEDDAEQHALREKIANDGMSITGQFDRQYFRSMYFREPGGVLLELATDAPGFAVDEPVEHLGESLKLPPWLEQARPAIVRTLPSLDQRDTPRSSATIRAPAGPTSYVHRYIPPERDGVGTMLMLHGTGGDENDLLQLGPIVAPGWGLLSPRGPVLERGMPRFFKGITGDGTFDFEDLELRTAELIDFVAEASRAYGFDPKRVVATGFSNGANIAASMLFTADGGLRGALLFAPTVPFEPTIPVDLHGTQVFISAGQVDPVAPPAQAQRLADLLRVSGADVLLEWHPGGHELSQRVAQVAKRWMGGKFG